MLSMQLYANKIKKVPPSIGELKKLKLLNCFNNQIGLSLPNEIGELPDLEEVNLAANKLAMLKDVHFAKWSNVQILNLNDNNLSAIGSLAPLHPNFHFVPSCKQIASWNLSLFQCSAIPCGCKSLAGCEGWYL